MARQLIKRSWDRTYYDCILWRSDLELILRSMDEVAKTWHERSLTSLRSIYTDTTIPADRVPRLDVPSIETEDLALDDFDDAFSSLGESPESIFLLIVSHKGYGSIVVHAEADGTTSVSARGKDLSEHFSRIVGVVARAGTTSRLRSAILNALPSIVAAGVLSAFAAELIHDEWWRYGTIFAISFSSSSVLSPIVRHLRPRGPQLINTSSRPAFWRANADKIALAFIVSIVTLAGKYAWDLALGSLR